MIREPNPEHARARAHMDTLAKAAGMGSGQNLIKYLEEAPPEVILAIGKAIADTVPQHETKPKAKHDEHDADPKPGDQTHQVKSR